MRYITLKDLKPGTKYRGYYTHKCTGGDLGLAIDFTMYNGFFTVQVLYYFPGTSPQYHEDYNDNRDILKLHQVISLISETLYMVMSLIDMTPISVTDSSAVYPLSKDADFTEFNHALSSVEAEEESSFVY